MSGLIFSVLLGAVTLASLSRTLRDILKFEEVADGHGWRGTVEKDGYLVDVFVKYDKDKAQFILPDASVPEEICKKVVRDLAAKIYAELKAGCSAQVSHSVSRVMPAAKEILPIVPETSDPPTETP